jgi:hypothetical protein
VDHRPAELTYAFERPGQVGDSEVRKGSGIPGTGTTLVNSQAEAVGVGLPPGSGPGGSRHKVNPKHSTPEALGTIGVVGRELDQGRGHEDKYGQQVAFRFSPAPSAGTLDRDAGTARDA